MKICCAIHYEKLSSDACKHLAQNPKFPSRTAIQALLSQRSKVKSLLQDTDRFKSFATSPFDNSNEGSAKKDGQIILYTEKLGLTVENEKIEAHLQGVQWRVIELEKFCKKLQTQIAKLKKTKLPSPGNPKSLPKLCSWYRKRTIHFSSIYHVSISYCFVQFLGYHCICSSSFFCESRYDWNQMCL